MTKRDIQGASKSMKTTVRRIDAYLRAAKHGYFEFDVLALTMLGKSFLKYAQERHQHRLDYFGKSRILKKNPIAQLLTLNEFKKYVRRYKDGTKAEIVADELSAELLNELKALRMPVTKPNEKKELGSLALNALRESTKRSRGFSPVPELQLPDHLWTSIDEFLSKAENQPNIEKIFKSNFSIKRSDT